MERIPKPGEFYRHFKNKLYQIIAVAEQTETGESLVVYQALYGDFRVYARPLSMFTSRVDRDKYPEVSQEFRFELAVPERSDAQVSNVSFTDNVAEEAAQVPNPLLLDFLEAEDYETRIQILQKMKGKVSQGELDSIYVVLDVKPGTGNPDIQLDEIRRHLEMKNRYDGLRLR